MNRSYIAPSLLFMPFILLFAASTAAGPQLDPALIGAWELTNQVLDAAGNPCPFVPSGLEFFPEGTVSLAGTPFGPLPAKTVLTKEERAAVNARHRELAGKKILLMKVNAQTAWLEGPFLYGYSVTKGVFEMVMPGWSPATYRRVR